jgi:hypothetical protein
MSLRILSTAIILFSVVASAALAENSVTRSSPQNMRLAQSSCSPASIEKFCQEYSKGTTKSCVSERFVCEAKWKAACESKHCCTKACLEKS